MALASEPAALLLDEPMAGVSAEDVDGLTEIIARRARDTGVAVVMVEHHMHVVLGLADSVAVLHHGQLLAAGTPTEVTSDRAGPRGLPGRSAVSARPVPRASIEAVLG